jgi:hypothetical protein
VTPDEEHRPGLGPGMPAAILLDQFGLLIAEAFGDHPYMVGSATKLKAGWRDVDVRLMLPDAEWDRLFGPYTKDYSTFQATLHNTRWALICAAISLFGQRMTGLPIDFQIQRLTNANEEYPGGHRHPIGMRIRPQPWEPPKKPCV